MKNKHQLSTTQYLLLSLVPYSAPNLKLVYLPHRFFQDLEKISRAKKRTLQSTLYRAQKSGLVERVNGVPVLTEKGRHKIAPYQAKKLAKNSQLMVVFDIPEEFAGKRRKLRYFLRVSSFVQVQKSVWVSDMDYSETLKQLIDELDIKDCIQVYEVARII